MKMWWEDFLKLSPEQRAQFVRAALHYAAEQKFSQMVSYTASWDPSLISHDQMQACMHSGQNTIQGDECGVRTTEHPVVADPTTMDRFLAAEEAWKRVNGMKNDLFDQFYRTDIGPLNKLMEQVLSGEKIDVAA